MSYYVYILYCIKKGDKDKFYTGYTNDLQRRVSEHQRYARDGVRKKYTGRFDEIKLAWYEEVSSISAARKEEKRIKRLGTLGKLKLIQGQIG
ncbi:MAG: GIY-YIG nuclease family protein [Candidatus Altiarchaeota archaeon]|nr:GIY-YIG nuclease family protein [Candidatus Altiarchaeota archaeon]